MCFFQSSIERAGSKVRPILDWVTKIVFIVKLFHSFISNITQNKMISNDIHFFSIHQIVLNNISRSPQQCKAAQLLKID